MLIPDFLARLEPIRHLGEERQRQLAAHCRIESYRAGTDPLKEQFGEGLCYLLSGELVLFFTSGGSEVFVGACDAARWPLANRTQVIRTRAITEVELLRVDETLLDVSLTWDQVSSAAPLDQKAGETRIWRTVSGALDIHSLTGGAFANLPPAHIQELLTRFERIRLKSGEVVVKEGVEGDYYYLIESGKCIVSRQIGGQEVHVADIGAGGAFGEESLVSGEHRGATVTMLTNGVLLRLSKPDFVTLLQAPLLHFIPWLEAAAAVAAGKAAWLDVRYPAEFTQDGLPGAINIPLNEIRSAFATLDPQTEYITYCRSGRRSSAAAFILARDGFRAACLQGGLTARKQESL